MPTATAIHQVLVWVATLLPGPAKGQYYFLYMVMDVWSRRILGIEVNERERSLLSRDVFDRVCRDEGIGKERATILRSENGASLRFFALAAQLVEVAVALSFSKPRVSNDNALCRVTVQNNEITPELSGLSISQSRCRALLGGWLYGVVQR